MYKYSGPGRRRLLIAVVAIAGLALASGCALIPRQEQAGPTTTYLLDATFTGEAARMSGETVALARIRARPGFESQQIAYSRGPARLGYYVESVWADSPAAMLRPLVVNALEAHPDIATVVDAAAPVHSRWRVELELLRLVHDFTGSDEGSRARITLRSVVYDMRLQRVAAAEVLEAVEPAASANAAGGAEAANEAADRVLQRLAEQVVDALDREPES